MNVPEIKSAVRARDGNCCIECGMTSRQHRRTFRKTLEVHRLTPGSPYSVDGCITLCRPCHKRKVKSQRGTVLRKRIPVSIPAVLVKAADQLAQLYCTMRTKIVSRAIREMLAREGLWPIKNKD